MTKAFKPKIISCGLERFFCGQDLLLFYWLLNNQIVAMLSSEAVALTIKKTLVGGIHINDRCAVAPLRNCVATDKIPMQGILSGGSGHVTNKPSSCYRTFYQLGDCVGKVECFTVGNNIFLFAIGHNKNSSVNLIELELRS